MVGHCNELGGRVMLRVSWPKVSRGTLGEGTETGLSELRYPEELHVDAEFELVTPHGALYADHSVPVAGLIKDVDPAGTELRMHGTGVPLVSADGQVRARLTGARFAMGESVLGLEAYVTV